jgi:hypothetical protein
MFKLLLVLNMCILSLAYKSLILKPGGLKGYYMLGISQYIKQHYNLSDWHYYGSSAGAWNALYLSCKKDKKLLGQVSDLHQFSYNDLYDLERTVKKRILNNFVIDDFDLSKLHICISNKRKWVPSLRKNIISDFYDLEDILECCISSSHVPYISNGNLFYEYRNIKSMDGGMFLNPHRKNINQDFILKPNIWNNQKINSMSNIDCLDINGLLYEGYNDACIHHKELDEIFI